MYFKPGELHARSFDTESGGAAVHRYTSVCIYIYTHLLANAYTHTHIIEM